MPQQLDWRRLLTSHGVEYQDAGPSNITTRCPFCGSVDTAGHYLAISTRGRGWRCFRNPRQHRGRSYVWLVQTLLRCTEERAREITGEDGPAVLPAEDEFAAQWRSQLGLDKATSTKPAKLEFPDEFRSIFNSSRFAAMFWRYLFSRGFTRDQASWAAKAYRFHYAMSGRWAYRLIIPVQSVANQLMTWTGRSINPKSDIRYLSLGTDEAIAPPGDLLLGLPLLWRSSPTRCLVVCEGPFDAIVVSVLGHKVGVWGTCLFGVNVSPAQAELLAALANRFDKMCLVVDPDARLRTLGLRERLPIQCKITSLLNGLKDPGELLTASQGKEFVYSLAA